MPDIPNEAREAAVQAVRETLLSHGQVATAEVLAAAAVSAALPGIVAAVREADGPLIAAEARADERRKVAREIAKEILRQKPSGGTQLTWDGGLRRAARVARQIGEDR